MAIQFLKSLESSFFVHDITYLLCIIVVIAMFTIVYLISLMGTKEQTYEEAKAAQKNDLYKKKGFWLLSYIVPKTIQNDVVRAKILNKRRKLNMVTKENSNQVKDKQKFNNINIDSFKIKDLHTDEGNDQENLGNVSEVQTSNIKNDKHIPQDDIICTKFQEKNYDDALNMVDKLLTNHTAQADFMCNAGLNTPNDLPVIVEKVLENENSSCTEFREQKKLTKNVLINNLQVNKKHKKRNKKCKNVLPGTNDIPNHQGNVLPLISDHMHVDGSSRAVKVAEEINTEPDVPEPLEERLVRECRNIPRGKFLLLLDTVIKEKSIDTKEIKSVQQEIESLRKHIEELESKVRESQSLMENANMQNQKLSNDNDQERLRYGNLENSLREKMHSMNQELRLLRSRLNEAQGYQHKVGVMQKALDDAKTNHTFALNALKEENKRFHENFSQRDNDAKVLEKKIQQLEGSFKKDLEAKVKVYEDKVTYMAKQNERLLNQIKFIEQDNSRNKDQIQILLGEKANAVAKCDELNLKLLDASRELESFKERNKFIAQIDKEARERENKLISEIVNYLKGMRSELCLPQEFLNSILKVVPQKNEQMLNDVYVNISRDVGKTQNMLQEEMEKMGVVIGEMSKALKSLYDPISQHEDRIIATNNQTCEVLNNTKDNVQAIFNMWEKKQQLNEDHLRLEFKETLERLRKIVDDLYIIKTDAHNKKECPHKLMTSLNETTSFLTTDCHIKTPELPAKDYEEKIQELKDKNNELRQKNWKVVEALKEKENYLTEQLKQSHKDESVNHDIKIKLTEQNNVIKIIQKLHNRLGDSLDFNDFVAGDDKFYSIIYEKALEPIILKSLENEEKITTFKKEMKSMENLKLQLATQQMTLKQGDSCKKANEKEAAAKVLEDCLISFKEHLLAIKSHVDDNERSIDKQIKLQMELSQRELENYNPKLSLSKPFILSQFAKLPHQEAAHNDKLCQSDMHPSLQEPWVEVIIEPLADPSLLRELEGYKMKLQNLQRELVALQSLSLNTENAVSLFSTTT